MQCTVPFVYVFLNGGRWCSAVGVMLDLQWEHMRLITLLAHQEQMPHQALFVVLVRGGHWELSETALY